MGFGWDILNRDLCCGKDFAGKAGIPFGIIRRSVLRD